MGMMNGIMENFILYGNNSEVLENGETGIMSHRRKVTGQAELLPACACFQ